MYRSIAEIDSRTRAAARAALALVACLCYSGCAPACFAPGPMAPGPAAIGQPTPAIAPGAAESIPLPGGEPYFIQSAPTSSLLVPILDREVVWQGVVDVVDDYFKIAREQRVRQEGDILIEGQIDTFPSTSPTILEPWRPDAASTNDRWENTLQSMRRKAQVRVVPAAAGFQVEVTVERELEDVERPEVTGVTGQSLRNDDSLVRFSSPESGRRQTIGWIPQGRDVPLEQQILSQLQLRLVGPGPGRPF